MKVAVSGAMGRLGRVIAHGISKANGSVNGNSKPGIMRDIVAPEIGIGKSEFENKRH